MTIRRAEFLNDDDATVAAINEIACTLRFLTVVACLARVYFSSLRVDNSNLLSWQTLSELSEAFKKG